MLLLCKIVVDLCKAKTTTRRKLFLNGRSLLHRRTDEDEDIRTTKMFLINNYIKLSKR